MLKSMKTRHSMQAGIGEVTQISQHIALNDPKPTPLTLLNQNTAPIYALLPQASLLQ
jgi:hypothetical protein